MLSFLVDEQLPVALARWIADRGHHAIHVSAVLPVLKSDARIAGYAAAHSLIVVSKDKDFAWLHAKNPRSFGLIRVQVGNVTTRQLLALFDDAWPQVVTGLLAGDSSVDIVR
jgi:predicted nuclease of predicted toxin-antitoxin system